MRTFIPKPYTSTSVTLRINDDTLHLIDAIATKYGLNRSEFINRSIEFAIDNLDDPEFNKKSKSKSNN